MEHYAYYGFLPKVLVFDDLGMGLKKIPFGCPQLEVSAVKSVVGTRFLASASFSSVPHTRSLEARIKEELVAQGLLDSDERPGPGGDSEDEVLAELQKRQAELKALTAHNRARKQELLR